MFSAPRTRGLLSLGALALATLLGGCVVYPAYPGYYGGGYGYPYGGYSYPYAYPYSYSYSYPFVGFGWGWGGW